LILWVLFFDQAVLFFDQAVLFFDHVGHAIQSGGAVR